MKMTIIQQRVYTDFFKEVKESTDEFFSGGFHFYDPEEPEGSGDQSQGKEWKPQNKDDKLDSVDASGAYQAASFSGTGQGVKYAPDAQSGMRLFKNYYEGFDIGANTRIKNDNKYRCKYL